MKKTVQITALLVVVIAVLLSMTGTFFYTEIDGQMILNTPIPTMTPSQMTVVGMVVEKPTRHGGGSGMDVRVKIESVDFSPIDLTGKEVIVLLDASSMQLKKGDTVTLLNCQLDFGMTKLEYCRYKQILK